MGLDEFEFVKNVIIKIDLTQWPALNKGLEECGANARVGPPTYAGQSRDPVQTSLIGIYVHRSCHPEKDKSRTVVRLGDAEQQLASFYSKMS